MSVRFSMQLQQVLPGSAVLTIGKQRVGLSSTLPQVTLPQWYAVFTFAKHEKRVFAHCQQRQIEAFLPLYQVRHKWKNRCTVDLQLPLFPCYFFVQIAAQNRRRVLEVPGVVSIVSAGRELLPVPGDYIRSLRDGLLAHRIEPCSDAVVGATVRITKGPFAGEAGVLERTKNGLRVILRMEMLSRSISVEVGTAEIEWDRHLS
ncbi:MAG: transcription termination/antitermination NusG family protein [Candidatus Sulfotelmatobacter sp.]